MFVDLIVLTLHGALLHLERTRRPGVVPHPAIEEDRDPFGMWVTSETEWDTEAS